MYDPRPMMPCTRSHIIRQWRRHVRSMAIVCYLFAVLFPVDCCVSSPFQLKWIFLQFWTYCPSSHIFCSLLRMICHQQCPGQSMAIVSYLIDFFSSLLCLISISVEIEILTILGSTSPVKERLYCPVRDGGEASRLVIKAAWEHRWWLWASTAGDIRLVTKAKVAWQEHQGWRRRASPAGEKIGGDAMVSSSICGKGGNMVE